MATTLCPTCGTARTGSFRYCRSCGFDFDAATATASTPAPAVATPTPAPEAAPGGAPTAAPKGTQPQPAGDVIVLQVRQLKLLAWVIAGGLIGAMLAGAIVVPFFGSQGVVLGSIAGIATIIVSAFVGLRLGLAAVGR